MSAPLVAWLEEMARLGMPFRELFQHLSDPALSQSADQLAAVSMMRRLLDEGRLCVDSESPAETRLRVSRLLRNGVALCDIDGAFTETEARKMLRNHAHNCFLKAASAVVPLHDAAEESPAKETPWERREREDPCVSLPLGTFDRNA